MPVLSLRQMAALEALLDARIPERLAALEAGRARDGRREPLSRRNAARQADSERLRAAIREALDAAPAGEHITAKHVLRSLEQGGISPLPSDRTVRWHLSAIRGNGNAAVLPSRRLNH